MIKKILFLACNLVYISASAQAPHKKAAGNVKPAPVIANYIAHEITRNGTGDHGIYYDTLAGKIKPADLATASGRQYQDIKVTLGAGDVLCTKIGINSVYPLSLSLLGSVNGHLTPLKINVDTSSYEEFKLLYKANLAGTYTLRISSKKRVSRAKGDAQYYYNNEAGYTLKTMIAAPESGQIADDAAVCDQLQFLLRQRLTQYMQITGTVVDTTMDVLDKKKIQSINHISLFTFYKNSQANISVTPGSSYVAFDQELNYKSDEDALQAQRYFIESFKSCLGPEWTEETDSQDANWLKLTRNGYRTVNVIFYKGYKYVQILL
ncbi:MAG: hypothetical protein ACHQHN_14830 [Sphingobacteriales bacterium]